MKCIIYVYCYLKTSLQFKILLSINEKKQVVIVQVACSISDFHISINYFTCFFYTTHFCSNLTFVLCLGNDLNKFTNILFLGLKGLR